MKNERLRKILEVLFLSVCVICLVQVGRIYGLSAQNRTKQEELRKMAAEARRAELKEQPGQAAGRALLCLPGDAEGGDDNGAASAAGDGFGETDGGGEEPVNAGSQGDKPAGDSGGAGDNPAGNQENAEGGEEPPSQEEPSILPQYAALYEENPDLTGWLSIEGMDIDYPVMRSGSEQEDDDWYLHHDFYGEESRYGCLYVRKRADLEEGTNFIIYGHNMKDGAMFGDLDYYLKESFYKEHSRISFNTLYEERTYEIVAVFRSQVYNEGDEVFKYYQFYQADTQEEFDDFYNNIKELSLYDTGVEAEFGDTFLTLSTCAYHVKNGRLVLVAKRL